MTNRFRRCGWTTLWLVVWIPVLMALFCGLLAVANLWLARVELENTLESAALAAAKEWGDAGGGDTLLPREVGVQFAAANTVRGQHLALQSNYAGSGGCNQNLTCNLDGGNLVFGAIDDSDPDHVVFNAATCPTCISGTVLLDASGSGGAGLAAENAWGISFHNGPDLPQGLRIDRIVIDLRASGGSGEFIGAEVLDPADPETSWILRDQSGPLQSDLFGFSDIEAQTTFTNLGGGRLQIDFAPDGMADGGFEPGNRLRFGYEVDGVSSGSGQNDGDGIGRDSVGVTIFFSLGGQALPPITGQFVDETERMQDCLDTAVFNPLTESYAVTPARNPIPDLPCPPTSAAGNNGQSYVLIGAPGQRKFAVRVQAIAQVPVMGLPFLGTINPACVQAKATAEYDCLTRRVRLVRVDEFICPGE
jgi:hypothetical protein